MKFLLLTLLLTPTLLFAQEEEPNTIFFAEEYDNFPACKTLYYANGRYDIPTPELMEVDLPNTTPVLPYSLHWNSLLNFRSFALEARKYGSVEIDAYTLTPYSREEVLDLIREAEYGTYADAMISNNFYLWQRFNIVPEAKLVPAPIKKDTVKTDYMKSGIIDGVWIEERKYLRIESQNHEQIPEEFHEKSQKVREEFVQPKLDSILQPFYFSNYEVTNKEYREFINWVSDSIELQMAYDNLSNKNALLLLNCSKRELKSLSASDKMKNSQRFGLTRRNRKKIRDSSWIKATEGMYYPPPKRFYKRRQRDATKIIYTVGNEKQVRIYPDTTGFSRVREIGPHTDFLTNLTSHPAFDNFPIVNVNDEQIMAFCHWKQRQLNKELQSKGIKITVRPPTIMEYEFAVKTSLGEDQGYFHALDQSKDKYYTFDRKHIGFEFLFYQEVNYSPFAKKKMTLTGVPSLNYTQWYQANQSRSEIKFLNGNVSEFALDQVTEDKLKHYKMSSQKHKINANFVLGSNYIQDVKTFGDDQYNAIFYKTTLERGKSSPLVGFRLVYLVERIN